MKFNIAYPLTGALKVIEVDDDKKCSVFFDKRIGAEVEADNLGAQFKGYILRITGGNDKDGFPMRQGVMVKGFLNYENVQLGRTRILMRENQKCYWPGRTGERKRKSVRGCIVGPDIGVLAVTVVKKGDADIEGLTKTYPCRLGPKRLTRIRRLYGYKKSDGVALVKKNIIRRTWVTKDGKKRQKAPKIQRLVTESRLRRRRLIKKVRDAATKRHHQEADTYHALLKDIRAKQHKKKSSEVRAEQAKQAPVQQAPVAKPTGKPTVTKTTATPAKQATQPVGKSAAQTQQKKK